jgi:Fe-S oxidoreductase
MAELLSKKDFYKEVLKDDQPINEQFTKECYTVFACRHKFCREICPVYREERNESYSSYGLHTSLLAVSQGLEQLSNIKNTITNCLECGACELRCPTTLFAGDFYKYTTTTVDLVRKVRHDLIVQGITYDRYNEVKKYVDEHLDYYNGPQEELTKWASDLTLPKSGEVVLFVDYFNATQTSEVPRLAAKILQKAGCAVAILEKPAITSGELLETNLDLWLEHAKENISALEKAGAEKVVMINPHEYAYFVREYPKHFGTLSFEVVFITDFIYRLLEDGSIRFTKELNLKASYHDPCALNKMCGLYESPRNLINSLPGVDFVDEDCVTQWNYCCGNGTASFKKIHPDIAYKIGQRRLRSAADLEAEVLIVACPHCKDQLTEAQTKSGINVDPRHILELITDAMGID